MVGICFFYGRILIIQEIILSPCYSVIRFFYISYCTAVSRYIEPHLDKKNSMRMLHPSPQEDHHQVSNGPNETIESGMQLDRIESAVRISSVTAHGPTKEPRFTAVPIPTGTRVQGYCLESRTLRHDLTLPVHTLFTNCRGIPCASAIIYLQIPTRTAAIPAAKFHQHQIKAANVAGPGSTRACHHLHRKEARRELPPSAPPCCRILLISIANHHRLHQRARYPWGTCLSSWILSLTRACHPGVRNKSRS